VATWERRSLGVVSFAFGVTILLWFVYNQFRPTPEFRSSFRSVVQLVMPVAMVWFGWRWMLDIGPGIETLQIPPEAPELVASIGHARRTLPRFLEVVGRHEDGAYVKFPMWADDGKVEHIWAYVHHHANGVFNVSLANTPVFQSPVETRRDVPESEMEDWMIMRADGRIEGAYSTRALFEHVDRNGIQLNRTMRRQRAQLTDLTEPG
jgi:uncharacterized protein YegJ (DUF2314 family)